MIARNLDLYVRIQISKPRDRFRQKGTKTSFYFDFHDAPRSPCCRYIRSNRETNTKTSIVKNWVGKLETYRGPLDRR